MKALDRRTTGDLVKLVIFMVVTTLATGVLVVTIGNLDFGTTREYRAEFTDATGVVKGDDIRIAGVKVGTVKKVEIADRTRALVTFSVQETTPLSKATRADIRYRNLVGQRYISLSNEIGDSAKLAEGATIPVAQTSPALDLTVLFNGFKPLFEALTPSDINQLSYEIVQVFQGEGGTLEGLLAHTASVTSTLADRDQIISALIDNLNEVLAHLGSRDDQLNRPDHDVPHLRRRAEGRPPGDPRLARPDLRRCRSRPPTWSTASASPSSRTSSSCAPWPRTSTATRPSSTGRCRCCPSSSRRSAAPRSTARGSTSTSASSRARSPSPA